MSSGLGTFVCVFDFVFLAGQHASNPFACFAHIV